MRKLKNNKGFTFVEMLACVITLLLLSAICGLGTDLAMRSYSESVFESDSQMLESTVDLYVLDILRHAYDPVTTDVENPNNSNEKEVESFSNRSYGILHGNIVLEDNPSDSRYGRLLVIQNKEDTTGTIILSENVYTGNILITDFKLWYNEAEGYFSGTYTLTGNGESRVCTFSCRIATVYE